MGEAAPVTDDPFAIAWFTTGPNGEQPAVGGVVDDPQVILEAMRRELAGVEHRLQHLVDPGEQRPFDRLRYQQQRAELDAYRDTVTSQIRAQEARMRAAARAAR
jgi:hypothetical protein